MFVHRLGYRQVECVIGHDFGCVPAFFCKIVLLGHPFQGSPKLPFDASPSEEDSTKSNILHELAQLNSPRKHYKWHYSTSEANKEMALHKGLSQIFEGILLSEPHPLEDMTARELAKLPRYCVMPLQLGMQHTVADGMTEAEKVNVCEKSQAGCLIRIPKFT